MKKLLSSLLLVFLLSGPVFAQGSKVEITNLPKTAFGEIVVGQLHPVMQGSFEYTVDNTALNENTVAGGGTVTQADGMAVMTTSTTTASTALFQSKQHLRYHARLGGMDGFTVLFTECTAGTEQLIGLADETGSSEAFKNGYMLGCDAGIFGFHRYQNDVRFSVSIHNWDKPLVAGTGNMVLDKTKLNVISIRFQFLGAGRIVLTVDDEDTGLPVFVHSVKYTNRNTSPSVHNPNFHHTMWVNNGSTTENIIMKSASYGAFIEGLTEFTELHRPLHSTGSKQKTTVTTEVAIVTIRNKASYAGKKNFIDVIMEEVVLAVEASTPNNIASCRMIKNTTLGGSPSYSDINTTDSVIEFDTAGSSVSGGDTLPFFELAGKNAFENHALTFHKIILNPNDTMTLACSSANSATIRGGFLWKELF